jgi:hypothetical protein
MRPAATCVIRVHDCPGFPRRSASATTSSGTSWKYGTLSSEASSGVNADPRQILELRLVLAGVNHQASGSRGFGIMAFRSTIWSTAFRAQASGALNPHSDCATRTG